MSFPHDKRREMQAKLSEGLKVLAAASQEDIRSLNDALLKIHAALEDFVRLELAAKAPHLREEVEDKGTTWKTLIGHSREHLGFSESDIQLITEANRERQRVAHGGNYSGSLSELVTYAGFVQKWVNRESSSPVTPVPEPPGTYEAPSPPPEPFDTSDEGTPWYRSTPFLLVCFFLLPPLWAILIFTDRRQAGLARLAAGSVLLMATACVLSVTVYAWFFFRPSFAARLIPDLPASTPSVEAPAAVDTEAPLEPTQPPPATKAACTIVWEEHPRDDLGSKNRSMVWVRIVEEQVQGSGMTHREFFDQVVEQNPELVTDDYEFKRGKTYLLPRCR